MSKMARLVEAMNTVVLNINDEDAYINWIGLVPDCATWDDFEDIASDPEALKETAELFLELVSTYTDGKVSMYIGEVYL